MLFVNIVLILFSSDAAGRSRIQLSYDNMVRFNDIFIEQWEQWLQDSPWKTDSFLVSRTPVAVTIRYGQNIPVCISEDPERLAEEASRWDDQRIWIKLRFVTFALATHIT